MANRNLALDVLRAWAILSVIIAHTVLSYGAPAILAPLQFGGTGVDLFFVLSGWLIGQQLFAESRRFGDIQLRRFWIRRWMRTLPAYYAVLCVTIAQQYLTKPGYEFPWRHLVFLQNYDPELSLFFISWSLCVEEQFYLFVAPVALFLIRRRPAIAHATLVGLLLLPSLFRHFDLFQTPEETHVRIDCCVMGVYLAYLRHRHPRIFKANRKVKWVILSAATAAYLLFYASRYINAPTPFDNSSPLALALIFGCWIYVGGSSNLKLTPHLQSAVMHVSTRSYAMYLVHVDALVITNRLLENVSFTTYFLIALAFTLVGAEILYKLVEKPIMDVRGKFKLSRHRAE